MTATEVEWGYSGLQGSLSRILVGSIDIQSALRMCEEGGCYLKQ
jgi:hypothetical protein